MQHKKNKTIETNNIQKKYIFRKVFTILAISLFVIVFVFTFVSFIMTIQSVTQLHNDGKTMQEIWAEISSRWWSFVFVIDNEHIGYQEIHMTFSVFGYFMIVLFALGVASLIASIIMIITFNSPYKVAQTVRRIDKPKRLRKIRT